VQVQHPLERLLTTWRYILQSQVLADFPQFSAGAIHSSDRRLLDTSWPNFVTYILLGGANREGPAPGRLDADYGRLWTQLAPLFAPYWLWCAACQPAFRPDFILKEETMERDGPAIVRLLNLTAAPAAKPLQGVHETTPDSGDVHAEVKMEEFYGQLTRRQVMDLYDIYRLDHELFDYSPEKYLAFAKD